ncbi:hypothetical protein HELRODRAFT_93048, partial [Helobdella robusta]|uniref:LIM zinc-binding domain-containing protein n=1 Tax=Helobdella robusta TaxID=6412 RepID=T1G8R9_HELRO
FQILYFPKCSACLKPIENETATVIGQQYHPECLFCSVCKSLLKFSIYVFSSIFLLKCIYNKMSILIN